jgi:opacity protein-like surface antigen
MKRLLATAAVITVLTGAGVAFAQTAGPPANPNASTPAVGKPNANNPGAPAGGANSFTEGQAKSRIEGAGYSDISGLMKDKDGVWRGKASKAGKPFAVSLDYQGNVVAR